MNLFLIVLPSIIYVAITGFILNLITKKFNIKKASYKTALIIVFLGQLAVGIISIIFFKIIIPVIIQKIVLVAIELIIYHLLLNFFYSTNLIKNLKIFVITILIQVILSLTIILPIRLFLIEPFYVKGSAMVPTLIDNEYTIINKFNKEYQRGDIIIFRYPKNPQEFFIKRIIGLPGEKIKIEKGYVHIFNQNNPEGVELNEPYLSKKRTTVSSNNEIINITDNNYYVLGDNRTSSQDSRHFGPINKEFIIGKYWFSPPQ